MSKISIFFEGQLSQSICLTAVCTYGAKKGGIRRPAKGEMEVPAPGRRDKNPELFRIAGYTGIWVIKISEK